MFGLDEINRQKTKDYRVIQRRMDSNSKYRDAFIKSREISLERVHKTGCATSIDDFLCGSEGVFLSLTTKQRKFIFDEYGKDRSLIEFLEAVRTFRLQSPLDNNI